jgi:hypothetical protein
MSVCTGVFPVSNQNESDGEGGLNVHYFLDDPRNEGHWRIDYLFFETLEVK